MRTIIHDLNDNELKNFNFDVNDSVISSLECTKNCIGCFSCWTRHPKKCVINDKFSNIVDSLNGSDEFIIISKSRYGCYSAHVKRVLERCIGYVLPYFTIRNNEIHHESRYDKQLKFSVYFYGDINDCDKEILNNLVKANSINLNAKEYKVTYLDDVKEIDICTH